MLKSSKTASWPEIFAEYAFENALDKPYPVPDKGEKVHHIPLPGRHPVQGAGFSGKCLPAPSPGTVRYSQQRYDCKHEQRKRYGLEQS